MYRFTLMVVSSGFLGLMSAMIGCDADNEDASGASCRSDLDCKGDRVCDRGMCVALDVADDDDDDDDDDQDGNDGNDPGPSSGGKLPGGDDGGPPSDDGGEPQPGGSTGPATDDDGGSGENSWFYGAPGGCIAAEYEVSFTDVDAGVCAPVCSDSGLCPPNLDGSATPFCFEDDWLCYLVCEVADPNACPAGATCWDAGEGVGLCLYGN